MNKYRLLSVSPEFIVLICQAHATFKIAGDGLPQDARVVRCAVEPVVLATGDEVPQTIKIIIESSEFAEVPEGAEIPEHGPFLIKHIPDDA